MRYLVAADGPDLDSSVAKRFGHALVYLLVDGDTMEFKVMDRAWDNVSEDMAGALLHMEAAGVVTGNIGPSAFEHVNGRGIQVYICRSMTAREAIEKVVAGDCQPADKSTLKKSIQDHRKRDDGNSPHGKGGMGNGQGRGTCSGKGQGMGAGKGRGRGR